MIDESGYNNIHHKEAFHNIEKDFIFNLHKISQESSRHYSHEEILKMDRIISENEATQKSKLRAFFEEFSEGGSNV